jgi:hypothetical protein
MKLIARIVARLDIRCVRFTDDGVETSTVTYSLKTTRPVDGGHAPSVMVVSGKGIITKDASAAIAATVTSDPETFIRTVSDGKISFMRRDRLAGLEKEGVLYIECLPVIDDNALAGVVERFRSGYLTWRRVLTVSALASLVTKRLMLPVLGTMLVILAVNFVISARIEENFREAKAELTALRKTSAADVATSRRKQAAIEEFSHRLPHNASRLSDMIAAAVPEKIVLSELGIAPVIKAPEAGKPLSRSERLIVVRGETSVSGAITEFTTELAGLGLGTVRLAAVEQERERTVLTFKIEITL